MLHEHTLGAFKVQHYVLHEHALGALGIGDGGIHFVDFFPDGFGQISSPDGHQTLVQTADRIVLAGNAWKRTVGFCCG